MTIESVKEIKEDVKVKEKIYPIAEIFTSQQGEGVYCGTMMTFIRLAGCTVGKPFPKEMYKDKNWESPIYPGSIMSVTKGLPIYTEQCTLYDGRQFACDTDYRVKERLTVAEIVNKIPHGVQHVCISGGEPLMHDLRPLLFRLLYQYKVHIETSGTIHYDFIDDIWTTVSPKNKVLYSMIRESNELKLLVDNSFDPGNTFKAADDVTVNWLEVAKVKPVYLQPINNEHTVNVDNLRMCMHWQELYPQFRLSLQLHKVLEYFIQERVL